jgi:GDP-L-fucose synthase
MSLKHLANNMIKERIFLTGGRGMVGQNIIEHPLAHKYEIIAPSSQELDLTNFEATYQFMVTAKPDIVIHCAGRVGGIQANIAHPVDFLITNIDLCRNVIMAAKKANVPKLLNLGSSCMYPRNAPNPLGENLVLQGELEPTNEGYAIAKIFATRLCEYINRENLQKGTSNVCYKTLIPCNLYGRYDKFSPQNSHLIPAIIHKIHQAKINMQSEVDIWGDGTAHREFMFAGDLAGAVLKAIQDFYHLPDVLNIGTGHDHSINEYYLTAAKVIGWNGKFVHDITKPVGMKQKLVDIARQRNWGWMPETSLNVGIEKTYQYYLNEKIK